MRILGTATAIVLAAPLTLATLQAFLEVLRNEMPECQSQMERRTVDVREGTQKGAGALAPRPD